MTDTLGPGAPMPGKFHWIITFEYNGAATRASANGGITPRAGATRTSVFNDILTGVKQQAGVTGDVTVLFFSLEPNDLGVASGEQPDPRSTP